MQIVTKRAHFGLVENLQHDKNEIRQGAIEGILVFSDTGMIGAAQKIAIGAIYTATLAHQAIPYFLA